MIPIPAAFSASYAEARVKFLEAAASLGLRIHSHVHPLKGRDGEALAMDAVRDGPADADMLLIVSSACHGVEGYCGSGVQVAALHDAEWREKARAQGVAVLYIHALNPYGFSHIRRVTQENVDLNRNFHDFSQALPVNTAYREVQPLLLPEQWPPTAENQAATGDFIATRGMPAFQAAVSGGQHEFPDGMFFGGTAPTWSNQTVRTVLRQHAPGVKRLAWIDLHTGLGPSGHGERIFAGRDDAATLARAAALAAARAADHFPAPITRLLVTGGGRHNGAIMAALADLFACPVHPVEAAGLDGDMLEAQAFAHLAVRVARGLPTSGPATTGVAAQVGGGQISTPGT